MMITPEKIYWITRLDKLINLGEWLIPFVIILGIPSLIGTILSFALPCKSENKYDDTMPQGLKNLSRSTFAFSLLLLIVAASAVTFIPTTKEMAAILVVPKIYNSIAANKELQKLPNNLISLSNEWLEELRPKKDK